MPHLVIVDGHAVIHRAYHSIPPLTYNGQPVNAIYGFYSMLISILDTLNPDYLIVCVDSPGPTFRDQEFIGYRAQRKPADRDLVSQLPLLPKTLADASIPHFSLGGYEADDLIATLARRSLRRHSSKSKKPMVNKVTIVTGDKDLMQLVDDKTELFMPIRGLSETKIFGPQEVRERLGVTPSQVIDLKALMGDPSDNYPGVAGIGPKTAVDLLDKFQHLDNVYQNLESLKPPIRLKLEKDKDNAYLSKKLATLIDNIPLKYTLRSARWTACRAESLAQMLSGYNFKSLVSRLTRRYNLNSTPSSTSDPNQTSLF